MGKLPGADINMSKATELLFIGKTCLDKKWLTL